MISVIIPAYNAASTLDECIRACLAQSYPDFEVIVVDDGSTDDTAQIAAAYPVTCSHQENQGPAAARNRGADAARGDILAFTDADCVPAPDWLGRLVFSLQEDRFVAAGGIYRIANPQHLLARIVQEEIAARHEQMNGQVDFIGSFNMAVERGAFHSVNGFDETFTQASGEDNDLAYRLLDNGGRLVFVPEAAVKHHHPTRLWPYLRTQARHGYWRVKLYKKHRSRVHRGDQYAGLPDLVRPPLALLTLLLAALIFGLFKTPLMPALVGLFGGILVLRALLDLPMPLRLYRRTGDPALLLLFPRVVALRDYARGFGMLYGVWIFFVRGRS